ncbi:MAG: UDP-N-acetylmuramoyl-L-alanyl-D-glutamate--2,6-diaminopimelate ligase [Planctomycetes bacterium]|nr:UDP-N-acetylmuramoyl-L-alanyl-D-glutamate--2,6-diaminopimelate ligase [Planctomycetota bacterium]
MRLPQLIDVVAPGAPVPDLPARQVVGDSRSVCPGDVFVAVPGTAVDGADFAPQAVERGAALVVAQRPLFGLGVPTVVVPDAALALGLLAHEVAGRPSERVRVTGVTGTNGKTTTTFLLHWILEASGRPASLLGTIRNQVGGRRTQATQTTPDCVSLHRALADSAAAGANDLVMEVSSHALDQRRAAGVDFACAVFTNLSRDHLDYHGSLEAYGAAKARLFHELAPGRPCVLNAADPFSAQLSARTPGRVVTYGWDRRAWARADVAARVVDERLVGTRIQLRIAGRELPLFLPLVGPFNVENALAAAAAAWTLGVEAEAIGHALEASQGVPGRLERIPGPPDSPTVLVDYAHTPDALTRVVETLRPLARGRFLVVFGCGGDRDRGKRPLMGRAVERAADLALLTSDNPRSEDPQAIIDEVLAGCVRPDEVAADPDRRRSIRVALEVAGPDDVVLIAGKGHEQGQIVGDQTLPFDDRQVARELLHRIWSPRSSSLRRPRDAA